MISEISSDDIRCGMSSLAAEGGIRTNAGQSSNKKQVSQQARQGGSIGVLKMS